MSFVQYYPAHLMKPANVVRKQVTDLHLKLKLSMLWDDKSSPLVEALVNLVHELELPR